MSVLIGLIDQQIEERDIVSWDTNKIGGLPIWTGSNTTSPAVPTCLSCGKASTLVSQLYCPLGGSAYHRCVYLFVCPGECSKQPNGWRVFRAMKYDESYAQDTWESRTSSQPVDQNDMWTDEQNDWGEGSDDWGEGSCGNDEGGEGAVSSLCNQNLTCSVSQDTRTTSESNPSFNRVSDVTHGLPVSESHAVQNVESFARLQISDAEMQMKQRDVVQAGNDPEISPSSSQTEAVLVASGGSGDGEDPQIVEEDIGLADSERWNAMATLLNTKLNQESGQVSSITKDVVSASSITFKPYYLCVVDEPADHTDISDHVKELIKTYEKSEGKQLDLLISERPKSGKSKGGPGEAYEKSELKHGDRIFHKFLKRLQRCPQQCVRYERDGEPLLVSKFEGLSVPACPHCGGERVFELQLLPPLIPWLKAGDETFSGVEFGTVLVFTCKNNCWPSDHDSTCKDVPLEEFVLVQADPDHHLYR